MGLYVKIKKEFGSFLLDTEFEADKEVMGILGESGCGKSMTLRCIAGVVTPDEGRIVLDDTVLFDSDKKIDLRPQQRQVGLLFQNYALFPNMNVVQNLMAGLHNKKMSQEEKQKAVSEIMKKFYLQGLEHHKPAQLSGGQQQRVALARILLTKPRLLMLDEPFAALDEFLRWKLELELADVLKEFGGTTLFVSHNRDEIYRICNRVCVMNQGTSSAAVPVKELFRAPISKEAAYLSGCKNFSDAAETETGEVLALDWGFTLKCDTAGKEKITSVGVRSHFIHLVTQEESGYFKNVFACKLERVIEDVFSYILIVSSKTGAQIRVDVSKELWKSYQEQMKGKMLLVGIEEKDIMLLSNYSEPCKDS